MFRCVKVAEMVEAVCLYDEVRVFKGRHCASGLVVKATVTTGLIPSYQTYD